MSIKKKDQDHPVITAILSKDAVALSKLLDENPHKQFQRGGVHALTLAIEQFEPDLVSEIASRGVIDDTELVTAHFSVIRTLSSLLYKGETVIETAISIMEILHKNGINPLNKATPGQTTVQSVVAVCGCHADSVLERIEKFGVDVTARDTSGRTALHICRHSGVGEWLVSKGVDPMVADNRGEIAGHYMAQNCFATNRISAVRHHESLLSWYIKKIPNIDFTNNRGETMLSKSISGGQFENAAFLIAHGASLDKQVSGGDLHSLVNESILSYPDRMSDIIPFYKTFTDHGGDPFRISLSGHCALDEYPELMCVITPPSDSIVAKAIAAISQGIAIDPAEAVIGMVQR